MRSLFQKLAEASGDSVGTLLVLGAGQGADLVPLRGLSAQRLILVEANPRQADLLSQRIDPSRGEEVWSLAVTPAAQAQATLLIVNQPAHSSLANLDQLPQYFQNLRVMQQEVVPARSLEDIIDALKLDPAGHHVLVMDTPGLAATLFDAMSDDRLQQFRSLIVRGGAKGLYAGEKPMDQVIAALRGRGFDLVADDAEAIFPHQAVSLTRNEAVCQARVVRERMHMLERELQDRARLATERESKLESLGVERDALLARMAELQAQRDADAAAEASLAADLRARVQGLTQERDTLTRQMMELQAQLDAGAAQSAARAKSDAEQQELIHQLVQKRDLLTRHVAELRTQLDDSAAQASAQVAGLKAQLDASAAQAERAQEGLAQVRQLTGERDELNRQLAEQQELVQRLVEMRDTLRRQVADYRKQVESNAGLAVQLEARAAELTAQKQLAEERLVQMLAQAQEHEASVKRVAERDVALAKLAKELESAKSLANEHQEKLERAIRLSQERGMRVIELERERVELDKYQSWLSSEVIKAEAHVDLIKEILLREPGQ